MQKNSIVDFWLGSRYASASGRCRWRKAISLSNCWKKLTNPLLKHVLVVRERYEKLWSMLGNNLFDWSDGRSKTLLRWSRQCSLLLHWPLFCFPWSIICFLCFFEKCMGRNVSCNICWSSLISLWCMSLKVYEFKVSFEENFFQFHFFYRIVLRCTSIHYTAMHYSLEEMK